MLERIELTSRGSVLVAAGRDAIAFGAKHSGRDVAFGLPGVCGYVPLRWRPLYVRAFERAIARRARYAAVPDDWRPTLGDAAPLARYRGT